MRDELESPREANAAARRVPLDRQQIDAIVRTVPGGADNVQGVYPLAPLQKGMLFHRLLNEKLDQYVLSTSFELQSSALVDRLIDALQKVIDRHAALRTAILWERLPHPVQVVYRRAALPVAELVLNPDSDPLEQLSERVRPEGHRLDLSQAPLMRLEVTSSACDGKWYGVLRVHHVICDHQSFQTIVAEALTVLAGRAHELPPAGEYAEQAAKDSQPAELQRAREFFRDKLAHVDEPTAPFGLLDVYADGSQIDEARELLTPVLAQEIRQQARRQAVSAARLFHAAWALVVAHTSGRDEVVFGTVLASRPRRAREQRVLGLCVNTLPLRIDLQGLSTLELVTRADSELSQLRRHESVPLTLAQSCAGVSGATPLFTSLLNYRRSIQDPALATSAAGVRVLERGKAWTNYPITLIVDDLRDGFLVTAQTDQRLAPRRMIDYLRTALQSLHTALDGAPQTPALALPILSGEERRQVVAQFNATRVPYPQEKLIHELFEEQVVRTPHSIAVSYEGQTLTYAELNARANRLARHLQSRGIGPDRLVGICVERSLEMVVGLLAILKAGGAYVPLDPNYPAERLAYMLDDAAPRVLLTQTQVRRCLPPSAAEIVELDADWPEIAELAADNLDPRTIGLRSRHLAYVIYTSGSTGRPKGAMNEHRALINRLQWMQHQYQLQPADRVLQKTPFSFDVSVWEFFWTLMSGAQLVVARPQGHQDPLYLRRLIDETGVTTLHFVPPMLEIFVDSLQDGQCVSLQHIVCSGEELPARLQRKVFERLPGVRLSNLYGPTEAAVDVTFWECRRNDSGHRVPMGRPISNTQIYVLDARRQPVPLGVTGEIYIGGAGVARGYLNRPDLTAEGFVADPFSREVGARMYRTRDLGRWRADGAIEYRGRNDHQVKIRGFRIELGEIETQLARHDQVKDAAVLAREDVPGEKRLVAYVIGADAAASPGVEQLRSYLKAALPEHMVPSAFVMLERFPLTPNGKLDRRALPAPDLRVYASRQYQAPQGEVEAILAGIWQSLLRVERVGREDNFFELGGHSLLIVQMMERLRRVGLAAEVRRVFDSPMLAELARELTREAGGRFEVPPNLIVPGCEAITPQMLPLIELETEHIERIVQSVPGGAANIQDIYPLAPLQGGILFHHLLNEDGGDTYIVPRLLSICSRERLDEFVAALQAVIDRHDVLRTAVLWEQLPQPLQVVYRRATLPVVEVTLDPRRDPGEQVREWLQPQRQELDLRTAPLIRLRVAPDTGSGQWYALLQFHHIIGDTTSQEMVVAEVVAQLEGRAQALPEAVPYRNHVAQSLVYARSHDPRAFFRDKLGDVEEPTAPFGLLDVHGGGTHIDEAHDRLEAALAQRVRTQARRLGVSAATLWHAAWGLVVAHTSGRDDVVFGSVLLGRLQGSAGVQRTLGMFINTLPLRLRLRELTTRQLVEQTQRELVELLSHEQASLVDAQRCSGIGGSAPLFSALFNYRHGVPNPNAKWSSAPGISALAGLERTNYPLTLSVDDLGEDSAILAQADRRVDPRRVLGYLRTALQSVVTALEQAPQTPALALPILPDEERRQVIELFNATQASYPRERLIHELFEEQVRRTPDVTAVIYQQQSLSYAELNRRANQLAWYLREVLSRSV